MAVLTQEEWEAAGYAAGMSPVVANYSYQLYEMSFPERRRLTYSVPGRSFNWIEYQRFLYEMIEKAQAVEGALAATTTDGPVIRSYAVE